MWGVLIALIGLHIVALHFRINYLQSRVISELERIAKINGNMEQILRKEAHKNK